MNYPQLKQLLGNNLLHGEQRRKRDPLLTAESLMLPNTFKVWGVDVSHWNIPPVDIPRMVSLYNMSFTIFKGCDGSLNTKYYLEHVAKAKEAGIPWGMYVWLYPNSKVSIDAQVNAWFARYNADPPPLGLFIDAEWTYYGGQPANPSASDLRMAHDKWKAKSGSSAMTYTAKGYADTYLIGFDWSREELWVANYNVNTPNLPKGATTWTFWQFSSTLDGKALDPNGNSELDGNYYNGSEVDFVNRYLGGSVPPGETMNLYKVVASGLNLRPAPGTNNTPIKAVVKDTLIWGEVDPATLWIKGTHYQQPGEQYATALDFYCGNQPYTIPVTPYVDPPLPAVGKEYTIKLTFDNADNLTGVNVDGVNWVKP